jgi:ATP-dependent helicase/nuclease subunit A
VAVEACAGAGKTWMLVSRIVRALLDGVDPEPGLPAIAPHEILAITFTKRAASEMRERLYLWLEEFAVASEETLAPGAAQPRGALATKIPVRQRRCWGERLASLYGRVLASGRPGADSDLSQLVRRLAAQPRRWRYCSSSGAAR